MTERAVCPRCGESLKVRGLEREVRMGVELTPFQARIFDIIRRRGANGISSAELISFLYPDRPRSRGTIATHISRINDLLINTPWRLRSRRGQGVSEYRLTKEASG